MTVSIRSFIPADLARLQEITVAAFDGVSIDQNMERVFGPMNGRDWRWRKARHIADDAAREPGGIFVAETEGRIVGYITTWIDRQAGIGHIPNLSLDADRRGQGLGRRLIERALDHFRAQGLSFAKIETLDQNQVGQHLYPAVGFREVARQIHYVMELAPMSTQTAEQLAGKKCAPCEGGVEAVPRDEAKKQLESLPGWTLSEDGKRITKKWTMKHFMAAMQLFERVAKLAEDEGHHPDLHLEGYRRVTIDLTTHAISGLSENDFILAAKIDRLPVDLKKN